MKVVKPEFKEYFLMKKDVNGGNQWVFRFPNDYGASVVSHCFSYGLELAVVKFDELGQFELTYDTPVTDDVIGHMTEEELVDTLRKIKNL
jgi:hypothetical protein